MKIISLGSNNPENIGGVESVQRNIAKHLPEKDWLHLFQSEEDVNKQMAWGEVKSVSPYFWSLTSRRIYSLRASKKIKKSKKDLIHVHGINGTGMLFYPPNAPIVYTAHGSAVGRFNKIGPNRLKSKIKPWFRIQEEKFINKKADKVVACSNIVKKELLEAYDIDESKVEVIENGVDTDKFSPISKSKAAQELNISSEQKYVCWLGRNPKLKGLDKAENAVKSLDGYKLLIAGVEGQDTSNKKFLGKIDPEKVPRVYSVSDALILPSMYEGFPIVVLEALSTGIPVVASDNVPNFSEYVENVSNEDYDKALRNILRKDVSSEEIREFTKQKYSWERKAEEYNEIYRELL